MYTYTRPSKKALSLIAGAVLMLVVVGGLGLFLYIQQKNTELRSAAASSNIAEMSVSSQTDLIQNKTFFTVSSDTTGLPAGVTIRNFSAQITLAPQDQKVLGASTETTLTQTRLCLTDVVEDDTAQTLTWKTTSKPLTGGEKTLYDGWKSMGEPTAAACQNLEQKEINAQAPSHINPFKAKPGLLSPPPIALVKIATPSAKPTTAPIATALSTPAPSPTSVPSPTAAPSKILYDKDNLKITTTQAGVTFADPQVTINADKSVTITVKGSLTNSSDKSLLASIQTLFTVEVPNAKGVTLQATLVSKSIRGLRPELPGIEVELTKLPATPTPSATASVSATVKPIEMPTPTPAVRTPFPTPAASVPTSPKPVPTPTPTPVPTHLPTPSPTPSPKVVPTTNPNSSGSAQPTQ